MPLLQRSKAQAENACSTVGSERGDRRTRLAARPSSRDATRDLALRRTNSRRSMCILVRARAALHRPGPAHSIRQLARGCPLQFQPKSAALRTSSFPPVTTLQSASFSFLCLLTTAQDALELPKLRYRKINKLQAGDGVARWLSATTYLNGGFSGTAAPSLRGSEDPKWTP